MDNTLTKETREFQAETKQLLDLMVHSIYTNREIFLRELVSNASDAIDKIRFESLTNQELLENNSDFEIFLEVNEENKTLTISDNGIGMNYQEVIDNIGTIAKSGTKAFLEKIQNKDTTEQDLAMIGQFGVGFYSAFMVADKVMLLTKIPGQKTGVKWESTGDGNFTIEEFAKEKRGTTIVIFLKEDYQNAEKPEENFLNRYTIQNLVKKYSDYIRYPIKMVFPKEEKPVDEEGKVIEDAEPVVTLETRTLNSMTPLWTKPKNEISAEDYQTFYKNMFHDWNEPLEIIHSKVEGAVEYTTLLFIPEQAPHDFYYKERHYGLKLYSRNVFIMDECREILPEYLAFVRGLVDSADFSLNISRELLQHSKQLKLIGKNLEKSIIKKLEAMRDKERPKYEGFWKEFGNAIKGGIYMERQSHEKLQDLLLFNSSHSKDTMVTLVEYLSRMPESQQEIYYASGKDRESIENLPQMELLQEKGLEVLYLFDRVDEFAVDSLGTYQEKKFKSISRGDLNLDDAETTEENKKANEEITKENADLFKTIKGFLEDKIADVRSSNRLKSSAVCLVSDDSGISLSMEHVLSEMNQGPMFKAKRILEINPNHSLFNILKKIYEKDPAAAELKEYSELLYEQALLIEGFQLDNPAAFANRVAKLMVNAQEKNEN